MPERDPTLYLKDMAEFCDRAMAYIAGHELAALLADRMRYDATLRNLELIGEAATHVPADIQRLSADIPWRQVVATRNRLAHAYLGIEPDTVWLILTQSVPALRAHLQALLDRLTTLP